MAGSPRGAYLNVTVDEGEERTIAGFGGPTNLQRLTRVKAEFDPENVFRHNHPIPPARD